MARSFSLDAVAEGVETANQAELLTALECSHAQGFHYARPVPPAELAELLANEALGELAG